jgi:hypothetical protein
MAIVRDRQKKERGRHGRIESPGHMLAADDFLPLKKIRCSARKNKSPGTCCGRAIMPINAAQTL